MATVNAPTDARGCLRRRLKALEPKQLMLLMYGYLHSWCPQWQQKRQLVEEMLLSLIWHDEIPADRLFTLPATTAWERAMSDVEMWNRLNAMSRSRLQQLLRSHEYVTSATDTSAELRVLAAMGVASGEITADALRSF